VNPPTASVSVTVITSFVFRVYGVSESVLKMFWAKFELVVEGNVKLSGAVIVKTPALGVIFICTHCWLVFRMQVNWTSTVPSATDPEVMSVAVKVNVSIVVEVTLKVAIPLASVVSWLDGS